MYNAAVTPVVGGNVIINSAEELAQDRATNDSTALAAAVSVAADLEVPTVEGIISEAVTTADVTGAFDISMIFFEPVNELTNDDLEVVNASTGEPFEWLRRAFALLGCHPLAKEVLVIAVGVPNPKGKASPKRKASPKAKRPAPSAGRA